MRHLMLACGLCLLVVSSAAADVADPGQRRPNRPAPRIHRTEMSAVVATRPSNAHPLPQGAVLTISREVLESALKGSVEVAIAEPPATGQSLRHVFAATALAVAVLSVPFIWRRRRGLAAAVALMAVSGTVAVLHADIAAPRDTVKTLTIQVVEGRPSRTSLVLLYDAPR